MNVRSVKYVSISFWHTNDRAIGTGEATREQVLLLWVSMLFMSSFLMGNLPISCRECCRKELNLAFYSFENCKIFFTTKHGGGIFFLSVFFHEPERFTGQQGKGEAIFLIPLYHFHLLHRYLDITRAITAESSVLEW